MRLRPAPEHQSASILLVDDNPHGLIARKTLLEELGYIIHTGMSGEEALELLSRQRVDLIITDFRMPNMDGAELIRRVRQAHTDMPIILLSGFVEPMGLSEASTGADVVLAKSAGEVGSLIRSVRRLLSRPPRKPASSEQRLHPKKARNAR